MAARIEWAMWANEQAVISCGVLMLGSVLAVSSNAVEIAHKRWETAAYGIALSVIVAILEYPRSKRLKGNTRQRTGQFVSTSIVKALGVVGRNYFVRFLLYLLACVPCLLQLGTVMGGISLLITACIYLKAAVAGEEWVPCERIIDGKQKTLTRNAPPEMAPPRMHPASTSSNEGFTDREDYENAPNARI